jgi:all-trans-8'-apo-beta-carotenal 15,15'-oxygenase
VCRRFALRSLDDPVCARDGHLCFLIEFFRRGWILTVETFRCRCRKHSAFREDAKMIETTQWLAAEKATAPQERRTWANMFQGLPREHGFEPLRVEGRIPPAMRGTLYRNGPGRSGWLGRDYGHWFDGDGVMTAIRIRDGRASGAARFVQSEGLKAERRLGRPIYGGYGTCLPTPITRLSLAGEGLPLSKQVANMSALVWDGRLFALGELGLPVELDPRDLSTVGETDLDGVVLRAFSSHPHAVAGTGSTYNFGVRYEGGTQVDLYELPAGGRPRRIRKFQLEGAPLIHDFVATPRYAVFVVPPLRLRPLQMLLGLESFERSLEWCPSQGTEIVIVPFDEAAEVIRMRVDPFFLWHTANAFELGDGIVMDYVRYKDFSSNDDLRDVRKGILERPLGGSLHRAVIDPRRRTFSSAACSNILCEFPRVTPHREGQRHRWIYANTTSPARSSSTEFLDQLAIIGPDGGQSEIVSFGEGRFPSEPIFVPRPGAAAERDGWLLSFVYDAVTHTSSLSILDAGCPAEGPVAQLHFDHHIPPTFHGTWVSDGAGPRSLALQ